MAILEIALLCTVILVSSYYQLKPIQWTVALAATLLGFSLYGHLGLLLLIFWLVFGVVVLLLFQPHMRKTYFTRPIMQKLKTRMPSISDTEREALESGDIWWEKDLLSGSPDWNKLLAYPKPQLTQEEQDFLDHQVETLCTMVDDWQIVRYLHDLPKKAWEYLATEKFFGLVIPKEYGGLGFSALAHSSVVAKIASRSVSAAINTMVPNSLGPGELLLHYGTDEQKRYYLPRLAAGLEIPCFALTGPDAGSDASSISDTGILCYDNHLGSKTLGIRLNWDKRYITLAPISTLLGLAVHLYDPDHLLGPKEDIGITLCLIPTSHPGVEVGRRHLPMYLAFMNGPTSGKDVFIPMDWIIGGPEMAGKGWHMLMECLSIGRAISLPALSTGTGKLIYRTTGAYARVRKQFNLPIGYFEGVEEHLSTIAGCTYLLEATRLMTTGAVDLKVKPAIASAIAKYHMTEMGRQVMNAGMDIHAGHAIQAGSHNHLLNVYLAMPMSITVEGANILTRNLIIFGQGSILCHPYLLKEINLLNSGKDNALNEFDEIFLAHANHALLNFTRSFWYALTGGRLINTKIQKSHPKVIQCFYQQLTRVSSLFSVFVDFSLLLLGGNLKRRERISARLGDILSQLYLSSAVLKYYEDEGARFEDLPYVQWCIQTSLHHAQTAFKELTYNFPSKIIGFFLRQLIPCGKVYHKPSDDLCQKIVNPMLQSSLMRERLTKNIYVSKEQGQWQSDLENAFIKIKDVDPIAKKFQNAIRSGKVGNWLAMPDQVASAIHQGLLTSEEGQALLDYEKLRVEVVKVSEFSFDLHKIVN